MWSLLDEVYRSPELARVIEKALQVLAEQEPGVRFVIEISAKGLRSVGLSVADLSSPAKQLNEKAGE